MTAHIEFGLLGPLVVRREGALVPVAGGRQRVLLATLLLDANHLVTIDQLTDALWGGKPPASMRAALHNQVRRLRDALGAAGRDRIRTEPGGYVIHVEPDELDVTRMQKLLASALSATRAGDWERASALAARAVLLWRGEPLASVDSDALARRIPDLTEICRQAVEIRLEAEMNLGHAEVIGELRRLAADQPLREHAYALLMTALYRCGRQGEALAVYQQARQLLIGELGCEPGPELRRVHQQILDDEPALATASEPATAPVERTVPVVPRELPAPMAQFAGRATELAALTGLLDRSSEQAPLAIVISAIGGTAGVGKTTLAVHWAHQAAGHFPDGQLYVNLRGFDPSGIPVAPETAIRGFLDALGVPHGRTPSSPDAQAGLYRSLLADRTMLIVLDNARNEAQVRPLLPASPRSLVLVTSRSELAGLAAAYGVRLLTLDVLTHDEAVQLLATRLGADRIAAEPDAAAEIAGLCACLPLALAIVAARAAAQPRFPLAALAAELRDTPGRLDALDAGDPAASVRAVFSWSYRQLSTGAARMFRLLGVHPGPDISVPAAASLAGIAEPDARRLLREVARAHLTAEHAPGRFAFHDLLRAYADAKARDIDSEPEREAAAGRVLDHYLHSAHHAAVLLYPSHEPVALASPRPGAASGQPADHRQALAWFEAEYQVLLAAVTLAGRSGSGSGGSGSGGSGSGGSGSHAWQLPWAMAPFLNTRGHYQEWAAAQRTALGAATRLGDIAGQAVSSRLLADACTDLGEYDQALSHYASSLSLYRRLGNRLGEAKVDHDLGVLAEYQGRYADALGHAEQALRLYQAIGHKAAEAEELNAVGWYHGLLGDYQQARAFCRQALAICAEVSHRRLEGFAWDSLGYAEHQLGNLPEAAACYERALAIVREVGHRWGEAETLTHLGDARHAVGDLPQAREAWLLALAILEDTQHPGAAKVRAKLGVSGGAVAAG